MSQHFNIAYNHWHDVQQNYNPSSRQDEAADVQKRTRRRTRTDTLLQGFSTQALSFAGKEGTLILLRRTNLLHKYTNELIYMPLLWVKEQSEVDVTLAYDAV